MIYKGKKIAVAMSGGLDSSVCALLLKNQGAKVIGITGKMENTPAAESVIKNAKEVCDFLEIEHVVLDLSEKFSSCVINYFENAYQNAQTPNPCVICNNKIKWGAIYDYAINKISCDFYATGHYADIICENKCYKLKKAKDDKKDQIYYLFGLSQDQLRQTIFPLSGLIKNKIREIATKNNLPCKSSKESQDICFIQPPDNTKKYLLRKFGKAKGKFVDINTNKVLGEHDGYYQFTIGQRKGIGIAASEPLYVISTNAKDNIVYVGFKNNLFKDSLLITNVNWQQPVFSSKNFVAKVKIRYNTTAKPCRVIPDNNQAEIFFDEPQSGITPGQVAVIYDQNEEFLIGGGWIAERQTNTAQYL